MFPCGNAISHRLLHFLEGTHLDLAHPLARDAELSRKLLERDRIIGQSPRLEDAPLALIENVECGNQSPVAIVAFLIFGEDALLARGVIDQPILPLAALAIIADRCIERSIAAETAVHVDNVLFRHAETFG